jgi:hypothetical protein
MKRLLFSAAALLILVGTAYSAVDPTVPTPTAVVSKCELVASTQKGKENENAGICIGATQDFIGALKTAGLSTADFDQQLVDLVVKLAPLAATDKLCDGFDDEVARAILLASENITNGDQKAQLIEISKTVAACQPGDTGALPDFASPTV